MNFPKAPVWAKRGALALLVFCTCLVSSPLFAQGVTTGALTGIVRDAQQKPVAGATLLALHVPSGTTYEAVTRADGRYAIQGMRVGGPYSVTVAHSASGAGAAFQPQTQNDIEITLGVATDLDFIVQSITEMVTVTAQSDAVFSSDRTGAATSVSRETLSTLPTISGRLESITRLTPQSGGNMQFVGQDNRLNNITVDGSSFNNSFGLAGTPGERTGVAPISLAAIEQIQVNVAPFDVRQGNFVGAGVNTVTRSGGNSFRGSAYYQFRDDSLVGTKAGNLTFNPGTFEYSNKGLWGSGPILPNRLFFFGNYEDESLGFPGTTWRANAGNEVVQGSVTRVLAKDLNDLSAVLSQRFSYDTGPYQDYGHLTPAKRPLIKLDYNINTRNKLSFRYNQLDSSADTLLSNSSSLGFGTRRTVSTGLNFQNSNYKILENIKSGIGELQSVFGDTLANNLIIGYTKQDESRASRGEFFPFVDILEGGSVYTSFGFEPFTPNNELRYNTFQVQDNVTKFSGRHTMTFGVSAEKYESENVFYSGAQSVYIYNSLADFYTDINDLAVNPNRTVSPITLRRFQVRWINIPGLDKPAQPLEVFYAGAYAQDNWRPRSNLTFNLGVRADVPKFGGTGFANPEADAMTFRDENGAPVQYATAKLPDPKVLWSPRFGFNWDVASDRQTQVRGGTGIFTGRPAYVWISNQIGTTGVLTGFEELNNINTRPFSPNTEKYKPTNVTGAPAASYELALTDPNFKFPQLWRTNFAVDRRLPWGLTGTAEFIYNRDVNGVYYINANLPAASNVFAGADPRPRWVTSACPGAPNRINCKVANTVVIKNQDVGRSWNVAGSVERIAKGGLWLKAFYSYGEAKNTIDPGSVAFGSWNNNQHAADPNNPGIGYSSASPGHRFLASASYRFEYFKFGATTLSAVYEARTLGNASYTFSGDLNGDGGTSNDLIYVHRDTSEMNFQQYTQTLNNVTRTFTAAEQAAAWEAYIQQDEFLSKRRGQYVQRGAMFLPLVKNIDLSVAQELFMNVGGRRNSLQFRADVLNFGNLVNKNWGLGQRLINTQPLIVPTAAQGGPADVTGRAQYRFRNISNELMTKSYEQTVGILDVYRVQFSLRYTFN